LLDRELDKPNQRVGKPIVIGYLSIDPRPGVHNQPSEMWADLHWSALLGAFLQMLHLRKADLLEYEMPQADE
jgi:hypothetical protein